MIPVSIKNKFSEHPQKVMRPISIRLSEDMIQMLEETADEHGFKKLQGLIRLYIREGLHRDNDKYTLVQDEVFIEQLREKGVSESIIEQAMIDANNFCNQRKQKG